MPGVEYMCMYFIIFLLMSMESEVMLPILFLIFVILSSFLLASPTKSLLILLIFPENQFCVSLMLSIVFLFSISLIFFYSSFLSAFFTALLSCTSIFT